jgi:glutamate-1-semialdehyde 2,1-aminomutase
MTLPLAGRTIMVTRPRRQSQPLADALRKLGATVVEAPAIRIEPPSDFGPLDEAIARLATYDWLVFASVNAVEAFLDRLSETRPGTPLPRIAAIGPATEESLRERGLRADVVPEKHVAEELFRAIAERGDVAGKRFLLPRADIARETLPELLREAGATVDAVVAYRTVSAENEMRMASELVERGAVDAVTFTSASTARSFFAHLDARTFETRARAASIGPITSSALRSLGIAPAVEAEIFTTEGLVDAILRHYAGADILSRMDRSEQLYRESREYMPGGVNSPVRAFRGLDMAPRFIVSAKGCRLRDEDGREYIDYIGAYGPHILGHGHPEVVSAVERALARGTSFGAPTALELALAKKIRDFVPSVESVRLVSSGTEATMSAIRLARAATRRDGIIKFEGCYHGHGDSFLIRAGSGALTFGIPDSPGVPAALASLTCVARYNDLDSVARIFEAQKDAIAALIVEPVAGNMGVVAPAEGFLRGLRELCDRSGALLIFDEVMTGFRVARGGAQELYGIRSDLTALGKVIGGGLPVGAYGGRRDLMELVAPAGPVYQAGTLSGNPLAVSAGLAQLDVLEKENGWKRLDAAGQRLEHGLRGILSDRGLPFAVNRVGSMLTLFFSEGPVTDFESATRSDTKKHAVFFRGMLERGVHLPPSQYEALFLSLAHEDADIDQTLEAAKESLARI